MRVSAIAGWRWYHWLIACSRPRGSGWSSGSSSSGTSETVRPDWGLGSWLGIALSVSFHGVVIDVDLFG